MNDLLNITFATDAQMYTDLSQMIGNKPSKESVKTSESVAIKMSSKQIE